MCTKWNRNRKYLSGNKNFKNVFALAIYIFYCRYVHNTRTKYGVWWIIVCEFEQFWKTFHIHEQRHTALTVQRIRFGSLIQHYNCSLRFITLPQKKTFHFIAVFRFLDYFGQEFLFVLQMQLFSKSFSLSWNFCF